MEFIMAVAEDIDALTQNRMDFVASIRPPDDPESFRRATRAYFAEHLNDGTLVAYLCVEGGAILSSCVLCISQVMPKRSVPNGRVGLLLNVYTVPSHQRRGLARALVGMMLDHARELGLTKVELEATEDGYPLYRTLGFTVSERHMERRL